MAFENPLFFLGKLYVTVITHVYDYARDEKYFNLGIKAYKRIRCIRILIHKAIQSRFGCSRYRAQI